MKRSDFLAKWKKRSCTKDNKILARVLALVICWIPTFACFNAGTGTTADGIESFVGSSSGSSEGSGTPSSAQQTITFGTTVSSVQSSLPPTSFDVNSGNTTSGSVDISKNSNTTDPNGFASFSRFTLIGRFERSDPNRILFKTMGSRIGVSFTGTSLSAIFTDTGSDSLNVIVDGAASIVNLDQSSSPVAYVIAKNLKSGSHTAWLIKRTESSQKAQDGNTIAVGAIGLVGMVLDGNATFLSPPKPKARRIESIGDSSFSGYGVDVLCGQPGNSCQNIKNRYSPRTQDVNKSVPGQTASLFDADIVNLSTSGEGVIWSYYDSGNCNGAKNITTRCLPTLWREVLPPDSVPQYDFSQNVDLVLVSAGGNDVDDQSQFPAGTEAFVKVYSAWLGEIRERYPRATILSILSASAENKDIISLGGALQQAVARAQAAQPNGTDPNMLYFNYFDGTGYSTYADIATSLQFYYGSEGHPSAAGSTWLAQRIVAFIGPHMGWTVGSK